MEQELPFIEHKVREITIDQRSYDGYVNATALCQACGKQLKHYLENNTSKSYLQELSGSVGIPTDLLVQIIVKGPNKSRGTWVHPQVAINLGQWASPQFAVLVSNWVLDWFSGAKKNDYKMPYHIRRYLINRRKVPPTHFSMLDQMTLKLLAPLEEHGYMIPIHLMPDIALGRMFSKWLREKGYDPDSFNTYSHVFDDGKRAPVDARLYPNKLMTEFNVQINIWINTKAMDYFEPRDDGAIIPLRKVIKQITDTDKKYLK